MLLAQAGTEVAAWSALATAVTQLGFSVFVAAWLLVKYLPHEQEHNRQLIREERTAALEREALRDADSKEKTATIVSENKQALQTIIGHCERESERRDKLLALELSVVNRTLVDVGETLEELRRTIADSGGRGMCQG